MKLHPSLFEQQISNRNLASLGLWGMTLLSVAAISAGITTTDPRHRNLLFGSALALGVAALPLERLLQDADDALQDTSDIAVQARQNWLYDQMGPKVEVAAAEVAPQSLPPYDLGTLQGSDKHCLVCGPTGTGKSVFAKILIDQAFGGAHCTVYDSDATPTDWPGLPVVGLEDDFEAIQLGMEADLEEFKRRGQARGRGDSPGDAIALVVEEYPAVAEEVPAARRWLTSILRRGRKRRMLLVAVTQETSGEAMDLKGETSVLKNFVKFYLGAAGFSALDNVRDKQHRGSLRAHLERCERPCLVEHDGRWSWFDVPHQTPRHGRSQFEANRSDFERLRSDFEPSNSYAAGVRGETSSDFDEFGIPLNTLKSLISDYSKSGVCGQDLFIREFWGINPGNSSRYLRARQLYQAALEL